MNTISPITYNDLCFKNTQTMFIVESYELQFTKCKNDKEHYILVEFKKIGYGIEKILKLNKEKALDLMSLFNSNNSKKLMENIHELTSCENNYSDK